MKPKTFDGVALLYLGLGSQTSIDLVYQLWVVVGCNLIKTILSLTNFSVKQCDQMARLFVQFLVIYNSDNLPKSRRKLPKLLQNFAQSKINRQRLLTCCQNGEISPNLVTLFMWIRLSRSQCHNQMSVYTILKVK